jgi:hypothetical protein
MAKQPQNGLDNEPEGPANIFSDLAALRLDDAASLTGLVEHLAHVPVRKPARTEFIRVHPADDMALAASIFDDQEERETYFVPPQARPWLIGQLKPVLLHTCVNRQGVLFLWPVLLPDNNSGRQRAWGETARNGCVLAKTTWVRLQADMAFGGYRIHKAEAELSEPVWPDKTLSELLEIGFRGRIIGTPDHPVIRRLRGLA